MPSDDWEYQVRHRAYELWNAAGRPNGKHQEFWEVAERELNKAAPANGGRADDPARVEDHPTEDHPADGPSEEK